MPDVMTGERQDDVYEKVMRHIENNEIESGVETILSLESDAERIDILVQIALARGRASARRARFNAIFRARDRARDRDRVLYLALDLARALTRDFARAHDLALTLARELSPRSKRSVTVIIRVLEHMLNIQQTTQQATFREIDVFTPGILTKQVAPYLEAVSDLETVIAEANDNSAPEVRIRELSQNSPVTAIFEGVANSFEAIREMVVPWRRDNARKREALARREQEISVAKGEMEVYEQLNTQDIREDSERIEQQKKRAELESIMLDNEMKRQQLKKQIMQDKLDIAEQIFARFAPNVPEEKKLQVMPRLLQSLDVLMTSPLELDTSDSDTPRGE